MSELKEFTNQFFPFIILIIISFSEKCCVQSLEMLVQADFSSGQCQYNLKTYWNTIGVSYDANNKCQYDCKRNDNGNIAYILAPEMSIYPNGLELAQSITKPYQFVALDFVYLVKSGYDSLNVGLYDTGYLVKNDFNGSDQVNTIEMNYSLSCSLVSGYMQVAKGSLQYNGVVKNNQISARFVQYVSSKFSWYGVLKVQMWANCLENCLVCKDKTNCQTCMSGFFLYTMPTGEQVCEQTDNCSTQNCFSCIKSKPTSSTSICVRCLPGYSLNAQKYCVKDTGLNCLQGQYFYQEGNSCKSYSSLCFYQQQKSSYTWLTCPTSIIASEYKCPFNKQVLLYELRNYKLFNCGCKIDYCLECQTANVCQKCFNGYIYSGGKCNFDKCDQDETFNPNTHLCEKNCLGQNCVSCTATECTSCKSDANYYIDTSSNIDCKLCNIANCKTCSGDGLCKKCESKYSLSADKYSCYPCQVNNCLRCSLSSKFDCITCIQHYFQQNTNTCLCNIHGCIDCADEDGSKCEKCSNGYALNLNTFQCECQVQNCAKCTLNDGQICDQCVSGYQSINNQSKCQCGVKNCQICNSSSGLACDKCQQGYSNINNQECNCESKNCIECDKLNGFNCLICQPNFKHVVDANGIGSCQCKVENCAQCLENDGIICAQCLSGYLPNNISTSKCSCGVLNCQICDENDGNICKQCIAGYLDYNNFQCNCQVDNCLQCDPFNGNSCQTCQPNYDPNINANGNTDCKCKVENCSQCLQNDGNFCAQCIKGYLPQNTSTVKCSCSVKNCMNCDEKNGNICTQCVQGFLGPSLDQKQCNCQAQYCQECNYLNGKSCQICRPNFDEIIDSNGIVQCKCRVENCIKCHDDGLSCDSCVQGFNGPQCQCNQKFCDQCDPTNGNICMKCKDQYYKDAQGICKLNCQLSKCDKCADPPLNQKICELCQWNLGWDNTKGECVSCQIQNCDKCKPQNPFSCLECQLKFELIDQVGGFSQICKPESCKIQKCMDCVVGNLKKCNKCQPNYQINSIGECELKEQNKFKIDNVDIFSKGYNITISFSKEIIITQSSLKDIIYVDITNFQQYEKFMNQKDDKIIKIDLLMQANCKDQRLIIKVKDPQFLKLNNLENDKAEQPLKPFVQLTDEQIKQGEATKVVGQQIQTTLMTTMLPIAMLGNFYVLFNTIDLTTLIYYLLYVKVRYPINITNFCSVFQNFQMAFIPNVFQVYLIDPGYIQASTPQKFLDNGSDAYFLNGAGQSFTIIVGVLTIYLMLKLISCIPFPAIQHYLQSKIETGWVKFVFYLIKFIRVIYFLVLIVEQFTVYYSQLIIYFSTLSFLKKQKVVFISTLFMPILKNYCLKIQVQQITKLFINLLHYQNAIDQKQHYIISIKEYCGFFDLTWTVYMYVVVSVFLQFFCFEFTESLSFLSYTLFSISFVAIFFIPICITIFIQKNQDLTDPQIQKQFGSLIGGLKMQQQVQAQLLQNGQREELTRFNQTTDKVGIGSTDLAKIQSNVLLNQNTKGSKNILDDAEDEASPDTKRQQGQQRYLSFHYQILTKREQRMYYWSKFTNVFLYFRKIIYAIFIIFMYEVPYLQMFSISVLNLFLAGFYFYIRPHEKEIDNIRNGLSESILIIMQIIVCTLIKDSDEEDEQDRINIGWILIGCAGIILFMHIFTVVIDLIRGIFTLIKDFIIIIIKYKKTKEITQNNTKEQGKINLSIIKRFEDLKQGTIATQIRQKNQKLSTVLFLSQLRSSLIKSKDTGYQTAKNQASLALDIMVIEQNPQNITQINIEGDQNEIQKDIQIFSNLKFKDEIQLQNDEFNQNKKDLLSLPISNRSKFNQNWSQMEKNFENYSIVFSNQEKAPLKKEIQELPENIFQNTMLK